MNVIRFVQVRLKKCFRECFEFSFFRHTFKYCIFLPEGQISIYFIFQACFGVESRPTRSGLKNIKHYGIGRLMKGKQYTQYTIKITLKYPFARAKYMWTYNMCNVFAYNTQTDCGSKIEKIYMVNVFSTSGTIVFMPPKRRIFLFCRYSEIPTYF